MSRRLPTARTSSNLTKSPDPVIVRSVLTSLALDIGLLYDAAIVNKLRPKFASKICAAIPCRIKTLGHQLRPDIGDLHRLQEPVGELRNNVFRCFRWSQHPEPNIIFEF